MRRKFLRPDRIRAMKRYYWLVPPDFFKDEALSVLQPDELLLYFYLHLVADTFGIARQNDAAEYLAPRTRGVPGRSYRQGFHRT